MRPIAQIVTAIAKAKYSTLLKSDEYTPQEFMLFQNPLTKKLTVELTKDDKFAMMWDSAVVKQTVACCIVNDCIDVSHPRCYDRQGSMLTVNVEERFPKDSDKGKAILMEIEEIKHLIIEAFPEAEELFV